MSFVQGCFVHSVGTCDRLVAGSCLKLFCDSRRNKHSDACASCLRSWRYIVEALLKQRTGFPEGGLSLERLEIKGH